MPNGILQEILKHPAREKAWPLLSGNGHGAIPGAAAKGASDPAGFASLKSGRRIPLAMVPRKVSPA
jgi:hypothetical protein